jgi:peptidoglycan/LPS O-acetylase OafA/YrhL
MQRVRELDSLRGLASLAIVVYHLWLPQVGILGSAVDLFFVLSGFLITSILLAHELNYQFLVSFYARRALRIWPIYYLSLVLLVLINPFTAVPGRLTGLPFYATFTQNISYHWWAPTPSFIPAFRHTWSLAIEEQFYLLWPLLVWIAARRYLNLAALALVTVAVTARCLHLNSWILATHCDGLALGAVLACLYSPHSDSRQCLSPRLLILAGAASVFWVGGATLLKVAPATWQLSLPASIQSLRSLALNVVFFSIVGLVVTHRGAAWLRPLRYSCLAYLGQTSYGLYLYHHIVFTLWDNSATRMGVVNHVGLDLAKLSLSMLIAAVSWEFIERPLLTLKDWFVYREAPQSTTSQMSCPRTPHIKAGIVIHDSLPMAQTLGSSRVTSARVGWPHG